jgi:hypothetical protein
VVVVALWICCTANAKQTHFHAEWTDVVDLTHH